MSPAALALGRILWDVFSGAIGYRASGVVCTIDAPIDGVRDNAHP